MHYPGLALLAVPWTCPKTQTSPEWIPVLPHMSLLNSQHLTLTCQPCLESALVGIAVLTDLDPVLLTDLGTTQSLLMS